MHTLRLHHNRKIDTARFEEGKRPPPSRRAKRLRDALRQCALPNQDVEKSSCVAKPATGKPRHPMGRSMAWWISQNARLQRGAFWTGTDAEQDLLKAHPESFAWSAVVSLVMAALSRPRRSGERPLCAKKRSLLKGRRLDPIRTSGLISDSFWTLSAHPERVPAHC
jgi:hypothetical protein